MKTLIRARNGAFVTTVLFSITMGGGLRAKAPGEKVRFEHAIAVQSTDSQFTNVADINGDGVLDILALKEGGEGFVSWYEGPHFRHHVIQNGNFNAGRPLSADVDQDGDVDRT